MVRQTGSDMQGAVQGGISKMLGYWPGERRGNQQMTPTMLLLFHTTT